MLTITRGVGIGLLSVALACGPSATSLAPAPADLERNLIGTDELRETTYGNVYDLIHRLKPHWLTKRGVDVIRNTDDVVVYLDNARLGGPEALRRISPSAITRIRYFNMANANFRFGRGHNHGAIQLSTIPSAPSEEVAEQPR